MDIKKQKKISKKKSFDSAIWAYTGDGKGKTTQAVGQAVRAASNGFKVLFIFFNKKKLDKTGEDKLLEKLSVQTYFFAEKHPFFFATSKDEMRVQTLKGLKFIREKFSSLKYDMIIMDEILISVRDGFISEEELMKLLKKKPLKTDVILTGRGLTHKIRDFVDGVSEIKNIKHPYDKGAKCRKGIEK